MREIQDLKIKIQDNSENPDRVQAGSRVLLKIAQPVMKCFNQAPAC
jgi:hypothetical protein